MNLKTNKKHGSSLRAALSAFSVSVVLSGCVSLLPNAKDAPTVYRLKVPSVSTNAALEKLSADIKVISIEYPQAPRGLSGTDIVLSPDGRRLTAAADASWAEPVPSQIRSMLIDTLAHSDTITGIIPKGGTRVPYRLNMEIRRFEAVFDNGEKEAPNAFVQLNLSLTDTQTRNLIGVEMISTNSRARFATVSAIVEAQDTATQQAISEVETWLEQVVSNPGRNH